MGIKLIIKTGAKATLDLYNKMVTYLFEQECGDLKDVPQEDIDQLKKCTKILRKIIDSK